MRQGIAIPIFAMLFGCLLVVLAFWQFAIDKVYLKGGGVMSASQGWPFLLVEIGIGVYIVMKGMRGYRAGCWPPPPM